jgi:hypothetical protein
MVDNILERWTAEKPQISWEQWTEVEEAYLHTAGAKQAHISHFAPTHPVFSPGYTFSDWVHFVPKDAIDRMKSTDDFESEYSDIVQETYNNIQQDSDEEIIPIALQSGPDTDLLENDDDITRESAIKAFLCRVLSLQLRGMVNFDKISSGQLEVPSDPSMNPPKQSAIVTVEHYPDLDHVEIAHFNINDPVEFFGTRYGDDTLMFEQLLTSNMVPEKVVRSQELGSPIPGANWQIAIGI